MYTLLKPFIFKIDPEMAHDLAVKSLNLDLDSLRLEQLLLKHSMEIQNPEFLGLKKIELLSID